MKHNNLIFFVVVHLFLFLSPAYSAAPKTDMKILKINRDKFIANKGAEHGITTSKRYVIIQNNNVIGTAKVVELRDKACIMEKVSLKTGMKLLPGDLLHAVSDSNVELTARSERKSSLRNVKNEVEKSYYFYYKGQDTARNEYTGGNAIMRGLAAGTFLNFIGWGVGHSMVASEDIEVPNHHVSGMGKLQKTEFSKGYKEIAKKKQLSNFHVGAAIGTFLAITIIIASTQIN